MPRFSANLGMLWPDRPLLDRIKAAAAAGFEAIELQWPYDTDPGVVRVLCARHSLMLLGINAPAGDLGAGEFGLGCHPAHRDRFDRSIHDAIAYAGAAGAQAIHVLAGLVEGSGQDAAAATFRDNLARVAPRLRAAGLTLLLEPMNIQDRPRYLYHSVTAAAAIARDVGAPCRLMLDTYHLGRGGMDVAAALDEAWPLLGHVQIASVPDRHEPDHGSVDHAALFDWLDARGYDGFVGAEYRPRGDTDAGLGWLRRIRRNGQFSGSR